MSRVERHVSANEIDRFHSKSTTITGEATEPVQNIGVGKELAHNHGMGNGPIGESGNPLGFDKAQFRTKVGTDHAQPDRGQNRHTKAHTGQEDTGNVIGELHQGQQATSQMQESGGLEQFGIAHQEPVRDGWVAKGKGTQVDAIVTETGENQKGRRTHGIGRQNVHDIGPAHRFFKLVIEIGRQPNPPGINLGKGTRGTKGAQKVVARPRIVTLVQKGHQISIPVPALGVHDKMQFNQGSTFLVGLTGHVINPMKFTIVVKAHHTIHVQYLVLRISVLQIKVGPNHGIGSHSHQDTVQGGVGSKPEGTIGVGGVKDGIRAHFLLGTHSRDINFIHPLHRPDIKMMQGKHLAEPRINGGIVFQGQGGSRCRVLFVRPDMGRFGSHRHIAIDPFPQFFNGHAGGNLTYHVAVPRHKEFGQETIAHENRVNDQGHEPNGMDHQHPGFGVNIRPHVGLFGKDEVRHILQSIAQHHGQAAHLHRRQLVSQELRRLYRNLQTCIEKGGMQETRDNGSGCHNESGIGINEGGDSTNRRGQLQGTPNAQSSRKHMSHDIHVMFVKGMKLIGNALVRILAPKNTRKAKGDGNFLLHLVLAAVGDSRHCCTLDSISRTCK